MKHCLIYNMHEPQYLFKMRFDTIAHVETKVLKAVNSMSKTAQRSCNPINIGIRSSRVETGKINYINYRRNVIERLSECGRVAGGYIPVKMAFIQVKIH